ncbi:MAG: 23S rRNA (pseudouridine(1915)-N(3))-methyltransferase RlmH [Bacteroidia bacterium]|nr:23S rRNA (pseudouridine(1915)-N(3))-methyltransferase RlmH [Bacteroidia bacterium]MCZ2276425.1 23S rRNA (pseudouridine(1915)-N(3))-methyltransferase RlmH [Bacteroidia bacterium]
MEIVLLMMQRSTEPFIISGIEYYLAKIKPYVKITPVEIKHSLNTTVRALPAEEQKLFEKYIRENDLVILLDEKGKQMNSKHFAGYLQSLLNRGKKRIVFVTGGAYGFSSGMRAKAFDTISLSSLTFSHQLVRLVFSEQLFRAFNILHGGKYHHSIS